MIHEYRLTAQSLYAATSIGLQTKDILETLNRLSKTPVPKPLEEFISSCTASYGKVKLLLKENRYYIESTYPEILMKLLKDDLIVSARVSSDKQFEKAKLSLTKDLILGDIKKNTEEKPDPPPADEELLFGPIIVDRDDIDEEDDSGIVHSFEIKPEMVGDVRRRCNELDFPLLEEYDFKNDSTNANLDIHLKPVTVIRPYQEKSLNKMFGNGRARSGIIVLPCGAGKTLVGITAACTIKKSVLVLCTSS